MFQTARLKLTGWYLLIIMMVSISFSAVIYRALTIEVERFSKIQRYRIENRLGNTVVRPLPEPFPAQVADPELIEYIKRRILTTLFFVNGSILILSGALGYMLAGRTLKPIAEMVDEQNRFISDASHELRTPLTALKSTMEVHLRDKNLSVRDARAVLTSSISDVNTLQSLSDSLLTLARYQKPNGTTTKELLDLDALVQQAVKQVSPLAAKKRITIKATGGKATLPGNRYNILDLVVILLDNAIKYTKAGGEIDIRTQKTAGRTKLSVKDNGIGIADSDLPHIFDRFYRANSARTKNSKNGYGLGLAIAKKIAEAHHGTIEVVSKPGAGSTFTVVFV